MTTATTYVRRATADGALVADPRSPFVRSALAVIDAMRATGELTWCPHLEDRLSAEVSIWPLEGPGLERLVCLTCWEDPGPAYGCLACERRPAPGLRRIVSPALPTPATQVVITGHLCRFDRKTLA